MCKRGDIYYVDFGQDTRSNKQCGIRPAVIVSNNRANMYSPVITVVPMTGRIYKKRYLPTHVFIPKCYGLDKDSIVMAEQVGVVDKKNLLEKRGHISDAAIMSQIVKAIEIQIGVDDRYN